MSDELIGWFGLLRNTLHMTCASVIDDLEHGLLYDELVVFVDYIEEDRLAVWCGIHEWRRGTGELIEAVRGYLECIQKKGKRGTSVKFTGREIEIDKEWSFQVLVVKVLLQFSSLKFEVYARYSGIIPRIQVFLQLPHYHLELMESELDIRPVIIHPGYHDNHIRHQQPEFYHPNDFQPNLSLNFATPLLIISNATSVEISSFSSSSQISYHSSTLSHNVHKCFVI